MRFSIRKTLFLFLCIGTGSLNTLSAQGASKVLQVPVVGTIEMGLAPFIERSIEEAESSNVQALILDIDTPGGRVDAAERIVDAVSDSKVPVFAFVNRRAFSAGALISLATERIYMRPGAVMGAVTPVDGSGTKASEKIVSAMRSEMRALAEARDLDPDIAEAMVDESLAIPNVIEEGKLLTLTVEEAVDLNYAVEVEDMMALLEELGLEEAEVVMAEINWAENLVRFFSNPIVAPFLLSLGFLGLMIEIRTPTFGLAGGTGLIALSLFFGSNVILGLAGLEDLLLFLAGIVFLGIETLVIPGFGVFGILGIVGILGGIYMSMLGNFPGPEDVSRGGVVLAATMVLILFILWATIKYLPKNVRLYRSGIFLRTQEDRSEGYESAETREELVGREGVSLTDLRPSGFALFGQEKIDVVSESEFIEEGTSVRIVSVEGSRHIVRAKRNQTTNRLES
tara:strand:+ start:1277 stop:2638 length:1362 start_codon:yes stop_codon:yes gene_type:complete